MREMRGIRGEKHERRDGGECRRWFREVPFFILVVM